MSQNVPGFSAGRRGAMPSFMAIAAARRPDIAVICQAIRMRRRLTFEYEGQRRIVEPYCHGFGSQDTELLRAIQVAGASRSRGFGFGKLWRLDKMSRVELRDESFSPDDRNYNPNDSAMARIHGRV